MEKMNDYINNNTNNINDDQITNIVFVNMPLMKILVHLQVFRTKGVIITY